MGVFEFEVRGMKGRINVTALVEHVNVLRSYRASLEERFRREHFDPSPEAHAVAGRKSQFEVEELTTGFLRDMSGEFLVKKMHAIERMTEIDVEMRELAIKTGETMTVEALEMLETRSRDLIRDRDAQIDELRRTAPEHAGPNTMEAARQHAERLRQWADGVAAERRLLKDIEALRTVTGEVDPAARARLLEQIPEMPAGNEAEVQATAAKALGFRPDAITVKLVGSDPGQVGQVGVSGAKVYLVRAVDGDVMVAAVKVFPKSPKSDAQIEEFARELSALDRLGREDLPNQGVVRRLGAGRTPDGSGVLIMSGAAGRSIDNMLVALSKREISLEEVRVACQRNGEALARLHSATANATPASPAVTEGFVKDFNESLQQLETLAKTDLTLARTFDFAAMRRQADALVAGFQRNPGLGSVVHGDYHPGNVFYDAAEGRITTIDVARTHQSIDAAGAGIASASRDAATFVSALKIFGQEYHVNSRDIAQLQETFLNAYSGEVSKAVSTDEALAFHRARYALRQFYAALTNASPSNRRRLTGSLAEFRADFGLR